MNPLNQKGIPIYIGKQSELSVN